MNISYSEYIVTAFNLLTYYRWLVPLFTITWYQRPMVHVNYWLAKQIFLNLLYIWFNKYIAVVVREYFTLFVSDNKLFSKLVVQMI